MSIALVFLGLLVRRGRALCKVERGTTGPEVVDAQTMTPVALIAGDLDLEGLP